MVCCGGDGTLSETAAGLLALPQPPLLGYIPSGSTNDCAATLRIPQGYKPAAELAAGDTPPLKVGHWDPQRPPFVYVAAFRGLLPRWHTIPPGAENTFGHLALSWLGSRPCPPSPPTI